MTTPLVARTRRADRDRDLLEAAGPGGLLFATGRVGLAGSGVALRVPRGEVAGALAAIEVDDEVGLPGCGPVAFGALPFRPDDGSELIVPSRVHGRAGDGTSWLTTVEPASPSRPGSSPDGSPPSGSPEPPEMSPEMSAQSTPQPSRFSVEPTRTPAEWCELVVRATKAMASGPLRKVVLAREVVVTADVAHDPATLIARLRAGYPGCFVFSVDGFVGASPELLLSRHGDMVRSHPMAGTAPRGGDPTTDARLAAGLLSSLKDRQEHQLTIDMVHDTLLPWCSYLDYEAEPSVVPVANVQHLATMVEGRLSDPAPSVLELVAALHPTPAVCGTPQDEALAFIADQEGFDRRRYTGTVGWVDGRGNGAWAVSVRCAELDGPVARVYAGNGIVADSEPEIELAETRAKLQAVLSVIIRP
ncbi:amonabactin biosynthesis isochorismate synthase AmoC [soil metagenome]